MYLQKKPHFKRRMQLWKRILATKIRFAPSTSELYSLALRMKARSKLRSSATAAAVLYMTAHRATRNPSRQESIESILQRHQLLADSILSGLLRKDDQGKEYWPKRVIKLKESSEGERGALVISFDVFGQLPAFFDMKSIMRDYLLILEPSWSGYCVPEVMHFINHPEWKVIVQAAEILDFNFLKRINSNLIPIDIGASNWVDDRTFTDLGLKKIYDCVMISHFGDLKRHYHLFQALKQIDDPKFRVCLIGEPWGGRTQQDLEDLARYYGVRDTIDIFIQVPAATVNELLNKSKVNLLLSKKEGANRSIFEGLFANVPGIVLKSNCGVNKSYVNEHTGRLIEDGELGSTLKWFRENYEKLSPRKWALENLSCRVSTKRIEAIAKSISAERGEVWTRPFVPKVNRPEFEYYDECLTPFEFEKYAL